MAQKPHFSSLASERLSRSRGLALAPRVKRVMTTARRLLVRMMSGVCGYGGFWMGVFFEVWLGDLGKEEALIVQILYGGSNGCCFAFRDLF